MTIRNVLRIGLLLTNTLLCYRHTCVAQDCDGAPIFTTASLEARDEPECRLTQKPACERIRPDSAASIFTGRVLKIFESDGHMILNGECVKTALQTVQVKVAENFVGSQSGVVTIHAGDINGFYFQTGKIYLIVAKPLVDRTLTVTSCGGIKARLDAKDDLAYLRSWTAMPKFGTLLGTATVVTHDPQRMVQLGHSLKYQRITVSGPRSFDVVTDKNGRYTVAGLSAGQYSVSIADPREVWPSKSQNADLVERGCAEVDFYIIDDQKQVGKGKH